MTRGDVQLWDTAGAAAVVWASLYQLPTLSDIIRLLDVWGAGTIVVCFVTLGFASKPVRKAVSF